MASIYPRGPKSNPIFWVRYKDVDGKWKNMSCGRGVNKKEALKMRDEKTALEINMRHRAPVKMIATTLDSQLEYYSEHEIPKPTDRCNPAPSTIERYRQHLNNFLEYLQEHDWALFQDVTPDRFLLYDEYLKSIFAPATTVAMKITINNFFEWAIKRNYTTVNPVKGTKNPKVKEKAPRFFSQEELIKIFSATPSLYINVYRFLFFTGLRVGECSNAEWDHLDMERRVLHIPVMNGNKTKKEGEVPLNDDVMEILYEQKRNIMKIKTSDSKRYIFVNNRGNKLTKINVERSLESVLEEQGIKYGTPHTFRHSTASHMVMNSIHLKVVQEYLRHSDMRQTLRYAHIEDSAKREASVALSLSLRQPVRNDRQLEFKRPS
jgi:site-specific recombinase XerD